MKRSLAVKVTTVAIIGYSLAILIGSLMAMPPLPENLEGIPPDKKIHFFAYFVLSVSWMLYLHLVIFNKEKFWKALTLTFFGSFVYGLIIEVLQASLTDSRSGDVWDLLANTLGILTGIFVISLIRSQVPVLK
ncbi:MAG: VanZ family protein [Leeuwenhoekiella sp.]